MADSYRYFSKAGDPNFACSCGCGKGWDDMDPAFLRMLDQARHLAGVPFGINSGYRCPDHNAKVSSTGATGPHTTGKAVDISATDSRTRFKIIQAALKVGVTRIGIARTFIHLDSDTTKAPDVAWFY